MTSESNAWKTLKAKYLNKVGKALSSVKHPHLAEVLEDVQSHLDQRFTALEPNKRTRKNLESIIPEMGPAAEYAELLSSNAVPPTRKMRRKYPLYLSITGIVAVIAILLAIVIFPTDDSLPQTKWNSLPLLDFSTRTALGHFEMFYEEKFHKATGYDTASKEQKDAMVEKWIQEIHGLDYEKAVLATAAIGDVKAHQAIGVLTKVATAKGGDNRIKWIAVRGLAKMADRETLSTLITLIDHNNKNVRIYAKVGLAEITGQFFGDSKEQWLKCWREHKHLTISRTYWFHSDQRPSSIPADTVPKDDNGHMLFHVDEWFEEMGTANQYRPFLNQADNRFILKSDSHPDVQANAERGCWGQEFYIRIPKSEYVKMEAGVKYAIYPMNNNPKYQWKVAPGVTIYKPDK
jgi:hypothetical protein